MNSLSLTMARKTSGTIARLRPIALVCVERAAAAPRLCNTLFYRILFFLSSLLEYRETLENVSYCKDG